jgi:hypothetical protein
LNRVRKVRSHPEGSVEGLGKILVASCVGVLLGAAGIWLLLHELWPTSTPFPPLDADADPAQNFLSQENREELAELRRELVELREEVGQLRGQRTSGVEQSWEVQSHHDPIEDSAAPGEPSERRSLAQSPEENSLSASGRAPFDEAALTRLGIHPWDAARLHERWEQFEMERLYLTDAAMREGWLMTPRFRREQQAARGAFREELGDESFDLLLYASGQHNRVVVKSLLERSPATEAGLEAGDVIVSYDDRRVFHTNELKRMTASGSAGESVSMEILREGRRVSLSVPRGPLGIFMRADSLAPEGN